MDSVKVAVRARPLVSHEIETGCRTCIDVNPEVQQIVTRLKHDRFTFNYAFDSNTPQVDIYETAIKKLVLQLFKGYNVTVLAYGQTGSGKTYTMGTCPSTNESDMGIIPRAIRDIYEVVNNDNQWDFKINVSFIELYNEQLIDLLSDRQHNVVDLREGPQGVYIPNLTQRTTQSAENIMQCLQQGSMVRTTGATAMNAQSSRSHAIFTIYIRQFKKNNEDDAMSAKFHLVDLAGSERSKRTKAEGKRFQEGININKELFVLGNVISALGDGASYVNYRDSKLTRLLQDSLGGNALTLMIACVSPADSNLDETINTLRYADRARKIKNKPIVNQDPNKQEINRLKGEVEKLQLALLSNRSTIECPPEHQSLLEKNRTLLEKNKLLSMSLDNALLQITTLREKALMTDAAQDRTRQILSDLNQRYENTTRLVGSTMDDEEKSIYCALKNILNDLNHASEKNETERIKFDEDTCKQMSFNNLENGTAQSSLYESIVEDEDRHAHILQQAKINNEIQEIDQNLAWKEALVAKLAASSLMEASIKPYPIEDIVDLKQQIDALHREKDELEQQLKNQRNAKADHKLAEQRRLRIKELEEKINNLSKKVNDQDRIIKMKEKSEEKIKQLDNEIMGMKRIKVQLINKMKTESEKFREARSAKEQEMYKLRQQNRQKDSKFVKMENLYVKQQNVYRRKLEESANVIKRLKDTLALQKQSKEKRSFLGNAEKINNWISQEFTEIINSLEAERTLDNLIEDRGLIAKQLSKLQDSLKDLQSQQKDTKEINAEIKSLNEDLELRSTQIVDLKQKLQSLESYQENKSKNRWDCMQTMADAKIALKYVFETASTYLSDFHKDKCAKEAALVDLQQSYDTLLDQFKQKELLLKEESTKLKHAETEHNDKAYLLLSRLEEYENAKNNKHVDSNEIETLKNKVKELENKLEAATGRKKKSKSSVKSDNWNAVVTPETRRKFYEEDEVEYDPDDLQNDPDWRNTPVFKRLQTVRNHMTVKRNVSGQPSCRCRRVCGDLCKCRKLSYSCSTNCTCKDDYCQNKEHPANTSSHESSQSDDSDISFKKPRAV